MAPGQGGGRTLTISVSGSACDNPDATFPWQADDGGPHVHHGNGPLSKGDYGSPPLAPGWQLATYIGHDDVGLDQIILRVAGDVAGVTVTPPTDVVNGPRCTLIAPTRVCGARRWSIHATSTSTGSTDWTLRESRCQIAYNPPRPSAARSTWNLRRHRHCGPSPRKALSPHD